MRKKFSIPVATVSINNFYYGDKRHGIRAECREWQHRVMHHLSSKEYKQQFQELRDYFNPELHSIHIAITAVMPHLYTSKDALSSKAHDCTNFEKPIVDLLCLPSYYGTTAPYSMLNLNVDDKFVTRVISTKTHGLTDRLDIVIKIVNRPKLIKGAL